MFYFNNVNEKLRQENIFKIENIIRWLLDSYYRAIDIKVIFIDRKGKIVLSLTYVFDSLEQYNQ